MDENTVFRCGAIWAVLNEWEKYNPELREAKDADPFTLDDPRFVEHLADKTLRMVYIAVGTDPFTLELDDEI